MNDCGVMLFVQGQLNAFVSCMILQKYYKLFFQEHGKNVLKFVMWLAYYAWQTTIVLLSFSMQWHIDFVIKILLVLVIGITSYKGAVNVKVWLSVALCTIWILVEFMVLLILFAIRKYPNTEYGILKGAVLSKIVLISAIIFLYKVVGAKNSDRNVDTFQSIILFLIPLGSMIVVVDIFYLATNWHSTTDIVVKLLATIIMLIINLGAIKVHFELSAKMELTRINTIYNQQLRVYDSYIKKTESDFLKKQKSKHDVKQHFVYLLSLMDSGNIKQGIVYIKQLMKIETDTKKVVQSGNFAIDSIINFKTTIAMKYKIVFTTKINIPIRMVINEVDFCVVLGNILDNAIEANKKGKDSKYIKLTIQWDSGNIYIGMVNTYNEVLRVSREGEFATTKKDKHMHGIGLKSVKKIVEKYDGMLKCSYNENEFITKILMYNKEK